MSLRGLLCCEVTKTKRDNILLAGLAAVLLSVGYSTFQMYLGMSVGERMYFDLLSYVVVFNNTTLVLPATLALVGGHMIDREYGAGTLKSILTIPVPFQRLLDLYRSCLGSRASRSRLRLARFSCGSMASRWMAYAWPTGRSAACRCCATLLSRP